MATARKKTVSRAYQLKISLQGLRPPVWRRVLVKSNITLSLLHLVIQRVMDWGGHHLHEFEIGRQRYGPLDSEAWDQDVADESQVKLSQLMGQEKAKLIYTYDFGDSWDHEILVEKVLPLDPAIEYPVCVKGKRACPPDDCGGVWGYMNLLEALKDPAHPEHEEMLEWLGQEIDPEAFDLEEINDGLAEFRTKETP